MRIVFTRFPLESRFGGAEVQTLALMRGLKEGGHAVAFLGSCEVLLEETRKLKMENGKWKIGVPPVTMSETLRFLWKHVKMRNTLIFQFSIFNFQFHADVVCMLSLSEKLLLTPYLHKQGINVVWIEHDRVGRWLTWNPWLPKLRRLSNLATTIVVSDLSKKIYEDLGFRNVVAILNGIDASRLSPPPLAPPPRGEGKFHIGTIARLSYDKGIDVLIDAVKDLSNVQLTIIGTGPEKENLAFQLRSGERACGEPVEPRLSATRLPSVEFKDHLDNLSSFYRSLDLFVLPSREHDPFGLVAGEAMMMGVPTMVTDACGIAGYLNNGKDAVIVPAASVEALHKAIVDLQGDRERRTAIGTNGRRTAQEKFSMDRMVERYESVLMKK